MDLHYLSQAFMSATKTLWAEHALTSNGWETGVRIQIDESGQILDVESQHSAVGERVGLLLPAMANLHSHAFQRAMAGMTETRGADPRDSFWSWRKLMYRFLEQITPEDAESIAAFGQMEMLEAGYASVGEFHYLHHQQNGVHYSQPAEMCERMVEAANTSGIGLTLLPVLYEQGGCDGRALVGGQKRFGNSFDEYARLFDDANKYLSSHARNANIGVAPHSLRAVSNASLSQVVELANGRPIHIHIAEQQAEVDELHDSYGARPVKWLLNNQAVTENWCLVHATQMLPEETKHLAQSQAVVGLCPITEANLGDGIFDGKRYLDNAGRWGIGTDSNVRISLSEELRTLEYSQRLRDQSRVIHADAQHSNGRWLYETAAWGGAQALQRNSGVIGQGRQADFISLNHDSTSFLGVEFDGWLDAWIFAHDDSLVKDVWCCGKRVVRAGQHKDRERIESDYRKTMNRLTQSL